MILIFGGLFLHMMYRLIKVNTKWLSVPPTYFTRQKYRTRRENPNSINTSCKSRKNPPEVHIKNKTLVLYTISKGRIYHILFKSEIPITSFI